MEPWFSRGVRSVSVGNYVVFYLVNDADAVVLITRIAYGKRNMEKVLP
jgi:plasmid stabilization system protein ParE